MSCIEDRLNVLFGAKAFVCTSIGLQAALSVLCEGLSLAVGAYRSCCTNSYFDWESCNRVGHLR